MTGGASGLGRATGKALAAAGARVVLVDLPDTDGEAVAEAEADPAAHLALPEVRRGLIAVAGGAMRLPQQVPPTLALEKLLTEDRISPEEALG